ncbi:eukaryotic translation initiation factor 3 subunit J [Panulirus ornatus]|uniref:eukaryotic translation initiation factor 3 subunit J n=1 Tax=Panulirus ornatus TaxID=150431 RepID=UPI003A84C3B8
MSDVEWDADDYEPPTVAQSRPTDKWDGEDEDYEIKENWDDEEEDKKKNANETSTGISTTQNKKKKKKIEDIIAEKEAKLLKERERRKKEAEEMESAQTPEAKLAEKMRLQKIQEDSDLQLANELIGTGSISEEDTKLLDDIDLSSSSGLNSFRKSLISKIRSVDKLEKRPCFVTFVEDVCRDLCQNLESEEVKRVSTILNSIYNEKVRASRPKSKKKTGGKAKLNLGQGTIADDLNNDYGGYNEYDDFI